MKRKSSQPAYQYSMQLRAIVLCSCFVAVLTGLSVRLIHVQQTLHDEVMAKLKEDVFRKEIVPAKRGDILDRDHRPLATSEPVSDIVLDKYHIPSAKIIQEIAKKELSYSKEATSGLTKDERNAIYYQILASKLAGPLKGDATELLETLLGPKKELVVQESINSQLARDVVRDLEAENFSGLRLRYSMKRAYVCEDLACHVLGYVYGNLKGASGVEASMNVFMEGKDGARHYDMHDQLRDEELPEHGRHVVLTIDATFQDLVEQIMDKHYKELRPESMTAIFADPSTGEILALVNRPGFRPADGGNAEPRTRQNLAVSATYEPGSTFKIITHGAAIDQGLVGLDNRVSCHNGYYIEDGWKAALRDASEGRESASVRDVIAFSLNTGTFMVAQQMKPASFYNYMASFGLGQKTGIRMPAEAKGTLPNPNNGPRSNDGWGNSRPKLSRVAIGYTMSATPLQILSTMSVVCNQGDLIKPRIVQEILTENYQGISAQLESDVVEDVVTPRTAGLLRNALIHAVEKGTGKNAIIEGYVVGGKTGTTEKVIGGRYPKHRNIASFLGFVGTDEKTELIGIVLVDDPQNDPKHRHGGHVAAPIFKEIAEAGMYHFGVRRLATVATAP